MGSVPKLAMRAERALAAGLAEAAFQYSLAAGQEALRLSALSEAIAHFENARQLAEDGLFAGGELETVTQDLYSQSGRDCEMNGDHDHALAIHNELRRLGL